MNTEVWKPVLGYEGVYEVSSFGRVRRVAPGKATWPGRVLIQYENRSRGGYLSVHLYRGTGGKSTYRVHRLVADAFHGGSELPVVRHLDGNPKNNVPGNLRHGTASENERDKELQGRRKRLRSHCKKGHEFTPENTRLVRTPVGREYRRCGVCALAASRRYFAKTD